MSFLKAFLVVFCTYISSPFLVSYLHNNNLPTIYNLGGYIYNTYKCHILLQIIVLPLLLAKIVILSKVTVK